MTYVCPTDASAWDRGCAQAHQFFREAKKITFLTHLNPDGDGISACAALAHIAKKLGKQTETVYLSMPQAVIKRQPEPVLLKQHEQVPDLIIMCDTANYDRLYYPEVFKTIPAINFDHHVSNSIEATINLVDPRATSTCDMLYLIVKNWDAAYIDQYVAEALLYGILYDSQVFHVQSTSTQALRVAADLIDAGADIFGLVRELESNKNKAIIPFWGKLLSSVQFNAQGTAAWLVVRQSDLASAGLQLNSLVGLENFMPQIADIDVCILFYEDGTGYTKVSLRSKLTDVNAIAKKFGGGGHKCAAGARLPLPIDQVVKEVVAALS